MNYTYIGAKLQRKTTKRLKFYDKILVFWWFEFMRVTGLEPVIYHAQTLLISFNHMFFLLFLR